METSKELCKESSTMVAKSLVDEEMEVGGEKDNVSQSDDTAVESTEGIESRAHIVNDVHKSDSSSTEMLTKMIDSSNSDGGQVSSTTVLKFSPLKLSSSSPKQQSFSKETLDSGELESGNGKGSSCPSVADSSNISRDGSVEVEEIDVDTTEIEVQSNMNRITAPCKDNSEVDDMPVTQDDSTSSKVSDCNKKENCLSKGIKTDAVVSNPSSLKEKNKDCKLLDETDAAGVPKTACLVTMPLDAGSDNVINSNESEDEDILVIDDTCENNLPKKDDSISELKLQLEAPLRELSTTTSTNKTLQSTSGSNSLSTISACPITSSSHGTSGITTPSTPVASPASAVLKAEKRKNSPRTRVLLSNDDLELLREPAKYGWKREVVYRLNADPSSSNKSDIYYFPPTGRKLRSMVDVFTYLQKNKTSLNPTNFTFRKEVLFEPPFEMVRNAGKPTRQANLDSSQSAKSNSKSPAKHPTSAQTAAAALTSSARSKLNNKKAALSTFLPTPLGVKRGRPSGTPVEGSVSSQSARELVNEKKKTFRELSNTAAIPGTGMLPKRGRPPGTPLQGLIMQKASVRAAAKALEAQVHKQEYASQLQGNRHSGACLLAQALSSAQAPLDLSIGLNSKDNATVGQTDNAPSNTVSKPNSGPKIKITPSSNSKNKTQSIESSKPGQWKLKINALGSQSKKIRQRKHSPEWKPSRDEFGSDSDASDSDLPAPSNVEVLSHGFGDANGGNDDVERVMGAASDLIASIVHQTKPGVAKQMATSSLPASLSLGQHPPWTGRMQLANSTVSQRPGLQYSTSIMAGQRKYVLISQPNGPPRLALRPVHNSLPGVNRPMNYMTAQSLFTGNTTLVPISSSHPSLATLLPQMAPPPLAVNPNYKPGMGPPPLRMGNTPNPLQTDPARMLPPPLVPCPRLPPTLQPCPSLIAAGIQSQSFQLPPPPPLQLPVGAVGLIPPPPPMIHQVSASIVPTTSQPELSKSTDASNSREDPPTPVDVDMSDDEDDNELVIVENGDDAEVSKDRSDSLDKRTSTGASVENLVSEQTSTVPTVYGKRKRDSPEPDDEVSISGESKRAKITSSESDLHDQPDSGTPFKENPVAKISSTAEEINEKPNSSHEKTNQENEESELESDSDSFDEEDEFLPPVSFGPVSTSPKTKDSNVTADSSSEGWKQAKESVAQSNSSEPSITSKTPVTSAAPSRASVSAKDSESGARLLSLPSNLRGKLNLKQPLVVTLNGQEVVIQPSHILATEDNLKVLLPPDVKMPASGSSSTLSVSVSNVRSTSLLSSRTSKLPRAQARLNHLRSSFRPIQESLCIMTNIFKFLSIPRLLRVSSVNKTWHAIVFHPPLWKTVPFSGMYVRDWDKATTFLKRVCVKKLSLSGMVLRRDIEKQSWQRICTMIPMLTSLCQLHFGRVPSAIIESLMEKIPPSVDLSAENIIDQASFSDQAAMKTNKLQEMRIRHALDDMQKGLTIQAAAKKNNVSETDLLHLQQDRRFLLTPEEEARVVLCCMRLSHMGFPISSTNFLVKCQEMFGQRYLTTNNVPIFDGACKELYERNAPYFTKDEKGLTQVAKLDKHYAKLSSLYEGLVRQPEKISAEQVFFFDIQLFRLLPNPQSKRRYRNYASVTLMWASDATAQSVRPALMITEDSVSPDAFDKKLKVVTAESGIATPVHVQKYFRELISTLPKFPAVVVCNADTSWFSESLISMCMSKNVHLLNIPSDIAKTAFPGLHGGLLCMLKKHVPNMSMRQDNFVNTLSLLLNKHVNIPLNTKIAINATGFFPVNARAPMLFQNKSSHQETTKVGYKGGKGPQTPTEKGKGKKAEQTSSVTTVNDSASESDSDKDDDNCEEGNDDVEEVVSSDSDIQLVSTSNTKETSKNSASHSDKVNSKTVAPSDQLEQRKTEKVGDETLSEQSKSKGKTVDKTLTDQGKSKEKIVDKTSSEQSKSKDNTLLSSNQGNKDLNEDKTPPEIVKDSETSTVTNANDKNAKKSNNMGEISNQNKSTELNAKDKNPHKIKMSNTCVVARHLLKRAIQGHIELDLSKYPPLKPLKPPRISHASSNINSVSDLESDTHVKNHGNLIPNDTQHLNEANQTLNNDEEKGIKFQSKEHRKRDADLDDRSVKKPNMQVTCKEEGPGSRETKGAVKKPNMQVSGKEAGPGSRETKGAVKKPNMQISGKEESPGSRETKSVFRKRPIDSVSTKSDVYRHMDEAIEAVVEQSREFAREVERGGVHGDEIMPQTWLDRQKDTSKVLTETFENKKNKKSLVLKMSSVARDSMFDSDEDSNSDEEDDGDDGDEEEESSDDEKEGGEEWTVRTQPTEEDGGSSKKKNKKLDKKKKEEPDNERIEEKTKEEKKEDERRRREIKRKLRKSKEMAKLKDKGSKKKKKHKKKSKKKDKQKEKSQSVQADVAGETAKPPEERVLVEALPTSAGSSSNNMVLSNSEVVGAGAVENAAVKMLEEYPHLADHNYVRTVYETFAKGDKSTQQSDGDGHADDTSTQDSNSKAGADKVVEVMNTDTQEQDLKRSKENKKVVSSSSSSSSGSSSSSSDTDSDSDSKSGSNSSSASSGSKKGDSSSGSSSDSNSGSSSSTETGTEADQSRSSLSRSESKSPKKKKKMKRKTSSTSSSSSSGSGSSSDSDNENEEKEKAVVSEEESSEETEDKCQICMRSTPPHSSDVLINWVDCDRNCGRWFHVICVKNSNFRSKYKSKNPKRYICPSCRE